MTDETSPNTAQPQEGTTTADPDRGETPESGAADKLNQTAEIRDIGPCKKHIKVTVERSSIDLRMNAKFSELVVDANVPGFRPGKAPRKIIERRFRKDVSAQVKGELMMKSLEQLAEDYDIAPLSTPDLKPDAIEIPTEGPMVYEFDVEVRPQFDLPTYLGLNLKRPVRTFTDADFAEEERRVLAPRGRLVPKPEGNAQIGDEITADAIFVSQGQTIGALKEIRMRVERQLAFKDGVAPKFAEQIAGANPGDLRAVDIQLSENSADPGLRGRSVQANVHVKDVKSLRLPELTPALLQEFGVHSPEQLRERIRGILERRLEYHQRQSARGQVLEQIAAAASWELPQDLLARQARTAMGRRAMEMRAGGMSEEQIRGQLRLLQQDVLRSTAQALKEHFVLQKIAEQEKIDFSESDIDDEIERIAAVNNESPRRIRAHLEKEDLLDALAVELIERKVLDLILQSATYEDVSMDPEKEGSVSTVEEQAVPGEMRDPTAVPPAAEEPPPAS